MHPRDRFEGWRAAVCDAVVPHNSVPREHHSFTGDLEAGSVGSLDVWRLSCSAVNFNHEDRHIANTAPNHLFVFRLTHGLLAVEQNGREAVLRSGHFALIDPMIPYSGTLADNSDLLVLSVPRAEVEARIGRRADLGARSSAEHGSLASSYLTAMTVHEGQLSPVAEDMVERQCLDLVALAVCEMAGAPCKSSRASLVLRIRSAVESLMRNPGLRVSDIATAAGVSVRHANAVLAAEQGTSLSRLLATMRLDRCRKALENAALAERSVSEIAYSWGFSDLTHFGRVFRAAYGVPPRTYRQSCRAGTHPNVD
ncbi:helix-turn-helix domain-containing protein [Methyloceanibacter methanicus]|uniref:helix-turn-helix domain-containing protein n=1 Tax=Methyloceanibacter methanicus TaxID=1774968 RepID=UPI003CC7A356